MNVRPTLGYLCLALALASSGSWAASGKTSDDTAPATPGSDSLPSADPTGTSGNGNTHVTDPTGANGALDLRHVEKKPATPDGDPLPQDGTQPKDGAKAPAKP